MAAPEYRQIWVPLENTTDCSQGFCSVYCPQWCYIIFPPPPPFGFDGQDESGTSFSPLVIAIIGILASAVLLVSYYTVVTKYCGNWNSMTRRFQRNHNESFDENHHVSPGEPWQIPNSGLDESVIKSITVCKYKRGDGLIEGTDCSVCLSEFQEDETLRLLPKCSHAFHLPCIDRWLQAHSNCPVCRASVVSQLTPIPVQLPLQITEIATMLPHESVPEANHSPEGSNFVDIPIQEDVRISGAGEDDSIGIHGINHDEESFISSVPNISMRAFSDLGMKEDAIIEITNEEIQAVRRSVSMDSSNRNRMSIADMLSIDQGIESVAGDSGRVALGVESTNNVVGEQSRFRSRILTSRNKILHNVRAPLIMKRSISSGRFMFSRYGRGKNAILPL